jgi:F0F1-type ATP synthase delta subunit
MSEPSTIARPYAEAVFRLAQAEGKLAEWADMLGDLAHVAVDARMQDAVSDPKRSAEQVSALFKPTISCAYLLITGAWVCCRLFMINSIR